MAGPAAQTQGDRSDQRAGAQQPVLRPARAGDPAYAADLGRAGRAGPAAQDEGGPQADTGWVRHQPAPRLFRGVRLQPGVETGGRISGHLRLDQRDPARPVATAPWSRRQGAQPHPALGSQRHRVPEPELIQRGDAVLDVAQIARWAGCVGDRLTVVPITDAKHDVFLSLAEPRSVAYYELDRWLDWYLRTGAPSTTPHSG